MADQPRNLTGEQFIDQLLAANLSPADLKAAIIQIVAAAVEQSVEAFATTHGSDPMLALTHMEIALAILQKAKPAAPGEVARRYAVTITEQEKVIAYFRTYVNP